MKKRTVFALIVFGMAAANSASADIVTVTGPNDTQFTMINEGDHSNWGAMVFANVMPIDYGFRQNILMRFTLPEGGPIGLTDPNQILSAIIKLHRDDWLSSEGILRLYRLKQSWVEGTGTGNVEVGSADWYDRVHDTLVWNIPGSVGGDSSESTPTATYTVSGEYEITLDVTNDVRYWYEHGGDSNNYGWVMTCQDSDNQWRYGIRFYSDDAGLLPAITIEYIHKPIITTPNGGESWVAGSTRSIQWETGDDSNITDVNIEYSDSNGLAWQIIDSNTANDGQYNWTVPTITSNQCLIRISDANDANIFDTSDNTFIIFECQLNSKADLDGNCKVDMTDFALFANDWLRNGNPFDEGYTEPLPIMWVYINDPCFTGYMSKYETTNAQYCQFLNAAKASGDITVDGNNLIGATGSYAGQLYYNLAGPGLTSFAATNGGAARINYIGGSFTVDSGFGNHPVTYVSWYGATAFCNYYGYRLPTASEWRAVADYDGTYTYGCGTSINNSIANYIGSTHPDGTTVVGTFGTYGYGMCDVAGNVYEWPSSNVGGFSYVLGGVWNDYDVYCKTTFSGWGNSLSNRRYDIGSRVCR